MEEELKQVLDKIIELSKTSTLCGHYTNKAISLSYAITDELILTEQSIGDSFSLWFSVEGMAAHMIISRKELINKKWLNIHLKL